MRAPVALALVALLAWPAHAQTGCATSATTLTHETDQGTFHLVLALDGREPASGETACRDAPCLAGAFLYRESNGLPGLQRDDGARDDTADGTACAPDQKLL